MPAFKPVNAKKQQGHNGSIISTLLSLSFLGLLIFLYVHTGQSDLGYMRSGDTSTTQMQMLEKDIDLSKHQLVLWSSDFHISPVADIKHILNKYFKVSVIDKSLSGHCHLSNTCERDLKVINKQNGIRLGYCPNRLISQFYDAYKADTEMNTVDAYLCTHATSLCELYMPFNKPLVLIASTRYEIGRHEADRWIQWNENIRRIAQRPQNTIAANNRYDQVRKFLCKYLLLNKCI
jgi:hypothetical protein